MHIGKASQSLFDFLVIIRSLSEIFNQQLFHAAIMLLKSALSCIARYRSTSLAPALELVPGEYDRPSMKTTVPGPKSKVRINI